MKWARPSIRIDKASMKGITRVAATRAEAAPANPRKANAAGASQHQGNAGRTDEKIDALSFIFLLIGNSISFARAISPLG